MSQRIVQQVLYLEVAARLRDMIAKGTLAPGSWVDELSLTEELGISRTPLREALKVLVSEGLMRLEPRRGCFVNELNLADLDQIFPLMAMLEGRCAYEAALLIQDEDLERLEPVHQQLQEYAQAGNTSQYYLTNEVIHKAIQDLANNPWLSGLVDSLRNRLCLYRHKTLSLPGRIEQSCAEHLAIFAALKQRDAALAQSITQDHLLKQIAVLHQLAHLAQGASNDD